MDSPSARKPGDFNWGSTLWHEMSHVFILTATNFRVPRWFTEGLAVHEEGERSPEWRDQPTPEVLVAIRDKKLLPVAKLDRGFVYPEYPAQVLVSYFQAGTICDFIKEKWGDDKLLDMVHSYAELKTTPQAIQQDLRSGAGGVRQAVSGVDRSQVWRGGRALRRVAREVEGAGRGGQGRSSTRSYCNRGRRWLRSIRSMWAMRARMS